VCACVGGEIIDIPGRARYGMHLSYIFLSHPVISFSPSFFFVDIENVKCNMHIYILDGQELVKIDRAVLRIPNLAIHLQSAKEREAFEINKEDHLVPIIASIATKSLSGGGRGGNGNDDGNDGNDYIGNDEWTRRQEPLLVRLLASELNVRPRDVIDFELNLFDVQRGSLGGMHSEFVHSSRLDNLASCYLSLRGLLDHVRHGGADDDDGISMIAMFDHEEGEFHRARVGVGWRGENASIYASYVAGFMGDIAFRYTLTPNIPSVRQTPAKYSREPVDHRSRESHHRRCGEAHRSRADVGRWRRRWREPVIARSDDPAQLLPER
jgi:hypothetical protein